MIECLYLLCMLFYFRSTTQKFIVSHSRFSHLKMMTLSPHHTMLSCLQDHWSTVRIVCFLWRIKHWPPCLSFLKKRKRTSQEIAELVDPPPHQVSHKTHQAALGNIYMLYPPPSGLIHHGNLVLKIQLICMVRVVWLAWSHQCMCAVNLYIILINVNQAVARFSTGHKPSKPFHAMNGIVANMILNFTSSSRFPVGKEWCWANHTLKWDKAPPALYKWIWWYKN